MATNNESRARIWGAPMMLGMLLVIGGTFALLASLFTSIASILYLGFMLVVAGLLEIVSSFRVRKEAPFLPYLLGGFLTSVIGGLFLYRPLASLASVTLLIAGYLFAGGLFRGVTAVVERYRNWGWDLAYGILALLLGSYIATSWPISSYWVLGTIVAAEIIARGFTLMAASSVIRDIEHGELTTA